MIVMVVVMVTVIFQPAPDVLSGSPCRAGFLFPFCFKQGLDMDTFLRDNETDKLGMGTFLITPVEPDGLPFRKACYPWSAVLF